MRVAKVAYVVAAKSAHDLAGAVQLHFYTLVEVLWAVLAESCADGCSKARWDCWAERCWMAYLLELWLCLRHVGGFGKGKIALGMVSLLCDSTAFKCSRERGKGPKGKVGRDHHVQASSPDLKATWSFT